MNPNEPQNSPILPDTPEPPEPLQPSQPADIGQTPSMEFVHPPEPPVVTAQPIQTPPYSPTPTVPAESVSPAIVDQIQPPETSKKKDVLGIVSIVCALVGLLPVGLVLGLVGASHAKKDHRSAGISRTGWVLNLILLLAVVPIIVLLVMNGVKTAEVIARDTERAEDLGSIEVGLEEYFNENFGYPSSLDDIHVSSEQVLIAPNGSTIKVNSVVADEDEAKASANPSGATEYTYTPYGKPTCQTTCDGYVLKALIEDPSDAVPNPLVKLGINNL